MIAYMLKSIIILYTYTLVMKKIVIPVFVICVFTAGVYAMSNVKMLSSVNDDKTCTVKIIKNATILSKFHFHFKAFKRFSIFNSSVFVLS